VRQSPVVNVLLPPTPPADARRRLHALLHWNPRSLSTGMSVHDRLELAFTMRWNAHQGEVKWVEPSVGMG